MEYKVIHCWLQCLEREVGRAIRDGWRPIGGAQVHMKEGSSVIYAVQSMVKKDLSWIREGGGDK